MKKKTKKKAKKAVRKPRKASSKSVSGRKTATRTPLKAKKRKTKKPPIVRQATVRYGGVIRTGSYENRRVSYELTAGCPRGLKPGVILKYLETIVLNQFYQAQVEALEGLPADMRDEIGDFSRMTPAEGAQRIGEFFARYVPPEKKLTTEQKTELIENLQKELKDLVPKIKAENKRLKGLKEIRGEDLEKRTEFVAKQKEMKNELKILRKVEK